MILSASVPMHRLILSLSQALDFAHPRIADHQHRVAFICLQMARRLGVRGEALIDLFHAAALHDIGLLRVENRILALKVGDLEKVAWHGEAGYELLKDNPLFGQAAELVRHHHITWQEANASEQPIPFACHILALADTVERNIDRDTNILGQGERLTERIVSNAGTEFHPDCVDAFRDAAQPESFWLDCVSERIYSVLLAQMDWPSVAVDERNLEPIAQTFARVVDAASHWTASHSVGVSATAVELGRRAGLCPREQRMIRAAGFLHDIGKLSVPSAILDKPGKLDPAEMNVMRGHTYHTFHVLNTIGGMPQICEWAAFHHERLDGTGYPFRHEGKDLTLGSRIMAVADVFTAITEDRPYRKGMTRQKASGVLEKLAAEKALDGEVVSLLCRDYEAVNAARRARQEACQGARNRLARILTPAQPAPAAADMGS